MWKQIYSWKEKFLFRAGKEILLKFASQAFPSYCMSIFIIHTQSMRSYREWWIPFGGCPLVEILGGFIGYHEVGCVWVRSLEDQDFETSLLQIGYA